MRAESDSRPMESIRARQLARQTEALERLADAVETQNDLLRHLVDVQAHRD